MVVAIFWQDGNDVKSLQVLGYERMIPKNHSPRCSRGLQKKTIKVFAMERINIARAPEYFPDTASQTRLLEKPAWHTP